MSANVDAPSPSFTPDAKLDLLFPANLISDDVRKALPADLHVSSHPSALAFWPPVQA
jgi:hypothetical protein